MRKKTQAGWIAAAVLVIAVAAACDDKPTSNTPAPKPRHECRDGVKRVNCHGHGGDLVHGEPNQSPVPDRIVEGQWQVGGKGGVKPGTYKVTRILPTDTNCYWQITKDKDRNEQIASGVLDGEGGRPEVTLAKGQWFLTYQCGEWKKK